MSIEISLLIAVVGCFVGLAGVLAGRDKKISNDGEWRGSVDTKLDQITVNTSGVAARVDLQDNKLQEHGERITAVEESAKQAHLRINELKRGNAG